jgi:hypothetical protein
MQNVDSSNNMTLIPLVIHTALSQPMLGSTLLFIGEHILHCSLHGLRPASFSLEVTARFCPPMVVAELSSTALAMAKGIL